MNSEYNELLRTPVEDGIGFLEWSKNMDEYETANPVTKESLRYLIYFALKEGAEIKTRMAEAKLQCTKVVTDLKLQVANMSKKRKHKHQVNESLLLSNIKSLCLRLGIDPAPYTKVEI